MYLNWSNGWPGHKPGALVVVPFFRQPFNALGLAVPFLIAAALFVPAMGLFRRVRDHYAAIQVASGLILVSLGALLFAGEFWRLRVYLNRLFELF